MALGEAFAAVCSLFRSDGFRQFVQRQPTWFTDSSSRCELVEPRVVLAHLIDRAAPRLHVVVNWQGLGSTLARSNICVVNSAAEGGMYSFISIGPRRTGAWTANGGRDRGLLVNTIAHELTHTVPNGGTCSPDAGVDAGDPNEIAYRDGGNDECSVPLLVSYQFGDLAESWYRAQGSADPVSAATDYFDRYINSIHQTERRRARVDRCLTAYQAGGGDRPEGRAVMG